MDTSPAPNFGNEATKEYYKFLLTRYYKNWYWFVISVALGLTISYIYLQLKNPIYQIQASVLVKDDQTTTDKQNILEELNMFSPRKVVENEIEIFRSKSLAGKVVSDLGLDIKYIIKGKVREQEVYRDSPIIVKKINGPYKSPFEVRVLSQKFVSIDDKQYPVSEIIDTPYGHFQIVVKPEKPIYSAVQINLLSTEDAVQSYAGSLKVRQPLLSSSVLNLIVESSVPDKGVAYLDRLIYFYELASLEDKNKVAANTLKFIDDRLKIIARDLTRVEQTIQNFKTVSGIIDLSTESEFFLTKAKETDTQLNQVNIQLGALRELEKYVQSKQRQGSLVPATVGIEDPTMLNLIRQANELELQREKISKTLPETSTAVEVLDNQIQATKINIADNIQSLRKIFSSTQEKLVASNRKLESAIRSVPAKERALLDISRQQSIKGNLYTYLLQKREETALSYASAVSNLRVIDPPIADLTPIKPVRRTAQLFGFFIGLLLPTIIFWLLDFFNNKVSRKSQIEETTRMPIIGEVIQAVIKSPLEISPRSRSVLSEQIRALRTNIQFFSTEETTCQTILVTSSISGEGKSFISLNLGASLAITDRQVVLLELDMRRPKLHKYLSIKSTKGLSTYLVGNATLDEIIKPIEGYPNYFFIPCGPLPPNPSELFASERMKKLLSDLQESFDFIIADTPPIGLVSDAQVLARYATLTIYIVRHLFTPKAYLKNISSLYQDKRFINLALLINGIVASKEYEYNYGYGSEYGYGYAYSSRNEYHEESELPIRKKKPWLVRIRSFVGL
ncbi:polysaccharide biosynthesis tyrosine autokinase [Nibrella viscosa]|uniref:Polysaccharide biosynthesis tyrosine autokinase n=1 Tax=Nibrella viscosa TaxID=1084524 RepID=A0ABP8KFG4_9BACT